MKKSTLSIVSSLALCGTLLINPSISNGEELNKEKNYGVIDLNNIDKLVQSTDANVTIKEITYEEFIQGRAEEKGISIKQAKKMYKNRNVTTNPILNNRTISSLSSVDDFSMHEINIVQNVASSYKPTVQIFVWMYSDGSFHEFDFIEEVSIDRNGLDNGTSKQFSGTVKGKITTPTTIWWYINGDFMDNGTTELTFTAGGGLGQIAQTNFGVTSSSNHYRYWENSGTHSIYR